LSTSAIEAPQAIGTRGPLRGRGPSSAPCLPACSMTTRLIRFISWTQQTPALAL